MDVGGWLRRLGLEQYEAVFRENEIDETILPKLTAEDLKDLGVSVVGHRRKLLDAITALRMEGGADVSANEANASWWSGVSPGSVPSVVRLRLCSPTWSGRPRCRRAWTLRTCAT